MGLNRKIIGYLSAVLFLVSACEKKSVYQGDNEEGRQKDSFFNYSMKQTTKISVHYDVPEGFKVYFEAFTQNPLITDEYKNYSKIKGVEPFLQGYTDANGNCEISLDLAMAAENVYVYSPMSGVPVLMSGKVENGSVKVSPDQTVGTKVAVKASKDYFTDWNKQNVEFIKQPAFDQNGKPELLPAGMDIDDKTLAVINATIPEGKALDLGLSQLDKITLSKAAEVKLYYVANNSSTRKNSLAYFTFTGENPSQEDINKNLVLIYPNLSPEALTRGDGVALQFFNGETWQNEFPAGISIGFVLLVDAWDGQHAEVNNYTYAMYSIQSCNNYNIPGAMKRNRPQMAMFKAKDDVVLSFEDQPYTEYDQSPYFGDFRDNIFIIKTNPHEALPPVPDGQDPEEPDGILMASTKGILAFEDNWPYEGDYDMNDVLIAYKSSVYFSNFQISGVVDTFTFLSAGAKYTNGFGYVLATPRSNIDRIERDFGYTCAGQGLDLELEEATIMLFDDASKVEPGTRFAVKIWYKEPIELDMTGKKHVNAPYNPFIVVRGGQETLNWLDPNRREIHLVRDYKPTAKANIEYFRVGDDLSDAEKGYYYVSRNNYPFGIDIPNIQDFICPGEAQRINLYYPKFGKWAESFGKENVDWYLHPAQ